MPAAMSEILAELDRLLEPGRFDDYCLNGLQVPGPADVQTIATGVSANAELFELAAGERADLLLVHHGLFWGAGVQAIDPLLKHRLGLLFDARMALAAYHLPLDAHPELGNNALLARALGGERLEPFALHHGQPIGFIATLPSEGLAGNEGLAGSEDLAGNEGLAGVAGLPADSGLPADAGVAAEERLHGDAGLPAKTLFARVRDLTCREPLVLGSGPARVRRLAVVSGAGADYLAEAASAGADALLTGEPVERATANARECHVHLIAAGHHATETFGIRRLGEHLAERFDLRHVFLDVPNPV